MSIFKPPTEDDIKSIIAAYEEEPKDPPPHTYELALVLGGTVSAGCYTAGVLDFLLEALDEWTIRRQEQERAGGPPTVPTHDLKIKVVAGTSGGGVCGTIFARCLPFQFPHVAKSTSQDDCRKNPFYATWVESLDIIGLTGTEDIKKSKGLRSVLDPTPLENAADALLNLTLDRLDPSTLDRSNFVQDPLELIMTLANLRGMAYRLGFTESGTTVQTVDQYATAHGDFVRFSIPVTDPASQPGRPRKTAFDAFSISSNEEVPDTGPDGLVAKNWSCVRAFALGTSAFPLGFPARELERPLIHYIYRPDVVPGDDGKLQVRLNLPVWEMLKPSEDGEIPADYKFIVVDGGTLNVKPVELARTALAGLTGRNPRDAKAANRGVMLIDPFSDAPDLRTTPDDADTALLNILGRLPTAFIDQSRYATSDLMLALDDDVYSRFIITPQRDGLSGHKAIASAGLSAFCGFLSKDYRRHDYLLGRKNCQEYLKTHFVLDRENGVFKEQEVSALAGEDAAWKMHPDGKLPIIPLYGRATEVQETEDWPFRKVNLVDVRERLSARLKKVTDAQTDELDLGFFLNLIVDIVGEQLVADKLTDSIMEAAVKNLVEWRLIAEGDYKLPTFQRRRRGRKPGDRAGV